MEIEMATEFYDGKNRLPKCTAKLYRYKEPYEPVTDDGVTVRLRELPEISYSTKWDDAGGGKLLDLLTNFANGDYVKLARGKNYEPYSPAGPWTAKIATEADWLKLDLKIRVFGHSNTIAHEHEDATAGEGAQFIQYCYNSVLPHEASSLKTALNNFNGLIGTNDYNYNKDRLKGLWNNTKDIGSEAFSITKTLIGENEDKIDFKTINNNLINMGEAVDDIIKQAGNPIGNYYWKLSIDNFLDIDDIDFVLENFSITPSIQMIDEEALYYDINCSFCSLYKVTKESLKPKTKKKKK